MEKYEFDTIKMEKEKAMQRYRTFKNVANVLRTVEIFVVVVLITFSISWTSSCVPSVVKFCNAFFRRVSSVFFSPHFVFLIGNVIIITLFANFSSSEKSGGEEESSPGNADSDVKSENANVTVEENITVAPPTPSVSAVVEVVVPEKEPEVKVVERVYRRTKSAAARMEAVKVAEKEKDEFQMVVRQGNVNREVAEKAATAEARRRRRFEEDELSNDEFRKKVEQFIEKQQRFIIKESKSVVLSSSNNNNFITAGKYFRSRSM